MRSRDPEPKAIRDSKVFCFGVKLILYVLSFCDSVVWMSRKAAILDLPATVRQARCELVSALNAGFPALAATGHVALFSHTGIG